MVKIIRPTLRHEKPWWESGALVAGVDEVGRGPLAGPLVAAAVVLPRGRRRKWYAGVRDSKIIPEPQRPELCKRIIENCEAVGIGLVQPWELDRIGMTAAVSKAMHTALVNAGIRPDIVLIDGKMKINAWAGERPLNGWPEVERDPWAPLVPTPQKTVRMRKAQQVLPGFPEVEPVTFQQNGHELRYQQQTIVDGDARCMSIAAASIVAKVARDHIMEVLHHEHPEYGWDENKGYSTPGHKRAIRAHGTCQHHRMLFLPVRQALQGILIP